MTRFDWRRTQRANYSRGEVAYFADSQPPFQCFFRAASAFNQQRFNGPNRASTLYLTSRH